MLYGITQCCLPPGRGDISAFPQLKPVLDLATRRDARLTWPGWLVKHRGGLPVQRWLPALARFDVDYFVDATNHTTTTPNSLPKKNILRDIYLRWYWPQVIHVWWCFKYQGVLIISAAYVVVSCHLRQRSTSFNTFSYLLYHFICSDLEVCTLLHILRYLKGIHFLILRKAMQLQSAAWDCVSQDIGLTFSGALDSVKLFSGFCVPKVIQVGWFFT